MILVADVTRAATSASPIAAGYRIAVLVLLAPYFNLFFLGALDASLAHFPVIFNLSLRKFSILPENDIETQSYDAEAYKQQGCKKHFHVLVDEA